MNKKNNIIITTISIILLSQTVFAKVENDTAYKKTSVVKHYGQNDYEEVIYEHLKLADKEKRKVVMAKSENLYYIPPIAKKSDENISKAYIDSLKNKNQHNAVFLSGYCYGPDQAIEVSRLSSYVYLKCNFNNINAELATLLIPDAFSKALIGKPLYLKIGSNRYPVKGGVVMNYNRTSLNLAHIVNDRKIETFLAKSGISGAEVATKQAEAYLKDKKASRTTQEQTNIATANSAQVVTATNTQAPQVSDYLATAGVQFISALVKNGAEVFMTDLPYLFKTQKNGAYYADLMVTTQKSYEQLPNISIPGTLTRSESIKNSSKNSGITIKNSPWQQGTINQKK